MEFNPVVVGLHIVIYVGVILLLKYLYFDPILAILRRRDALTQGRQESTAQLKQDITRLKALYFSEVDSLKSELYEKKQSALNEIQEESQKSFEIAKKNSENEFLVYQEKLEAQVEKTRQVLPDVGSHLGDDIVESIVSSRVVRF